MSCWKIIQQMDEKNISLDEIFINAYDDEDEQYLRNIFEKLMSAEFIVTEDKVLDTYTYDIEKISVNLTYRCNLRCKHCCVDAKHVSEFTKEDELDTESLKKVLKKVAARICFWIYGL